MREALRLVDLAILDLEANHKLAFSLPLIYLRLVQRDLMSRVKGGTVIPRPIPKSKRGGIDVCTDQALTESGLDR